MTKPKCCKTQIPTYGTDPVNGTMCIIMNDISTAQLMLHRSRKMGDEKYLHGFECLINQAWDRYKCNKDRLPRFGDKQRVPKFKSMYNESLTNLIKMKIIKESERKLFKYRMSTP